jgi:hypothetical protein
MLLLGIVAIVVFIYYDSIIVEGAVIQSSVAAVGSACIQLATGFISFSVAPNRKHWLCSRTYLNDPFPRCHQSVSDLSPRFQALFLVSTNKQKEDVRCQFL